MRCRRNKWQLKFCLDTLSYRYNSVALQFKLGNKLVTGILKGTVDHWIFKSGSAAFLRYIPNGTLSNYGFWIDSVPSNISELYNKIDEAALKAGYDLAQKEEYV